MSKSSEKNSEINNNVSSVLKKFHQIINALGEFKDRYNKKFNFSKLVEYLKIPSKEIDELIYFILKIQKQFNSVFKDYELKKKIINGQIYLVSEKKKPALNRLYNIIFVPENVKLSKEQAKWLSDIIYLFKFVQKGKGFDLKNSHTPELLKNLKNLKDEYPYLFLENGNNLTYPTEIALELGSQILSYNKSNKPIKNLKIKEFKFVINQ